MAISEIKVTGWIPFNDMPEVGEFDRATSVPYKGLDDRKTRRAIGQAISELARQGAVRITLTPPGISPERGSELAVALTKIKGHGWLSAKVQLPDGPLSLRIRR